jgi:hypothetical protein
MHIFILKVNWIIKTLQLFLQICRKMFAISHWSQWVILLVISYSIRFWNVLFSRNILGCDGNIIIFFLIRKVGESKHIFWDHVIETLIFIKKMLDQFMTLKRIKKLITSQPIFPWLSISLYDRTSARKGIRSTGKQFLSRTMLRQKLYWVPPSQKPHFLYHTEGHYHHEILQAAQYNWMYLTHWDYHYHHAPTLPYYSYISNIRSFMQLSLISSHKLKKLPLEWYKKITNLSSLKLFLWLQWSNRGGWDGWDI